MVPGSHLWAQQSAEIGPGQCSVFGPVRVKRTRETLVKRVLETIDHYQAVHSAKHLSTLDISRPNQTMAELAALAPLA